MGRTPCCEKVGLKKGSWTREEDHKLVSYVEQHGPGGWRALPSKAGLQRCGKSCRLRWTNYLRPDIKRGKFNVEEEQTIIRLHALLGNKWSMIANHLPKRTDNEIKNYWNTHLRKRLIKMGIDPISHKRKIDAFGINHSKNVANLSHMAQWENARLEAESRLKREANKLVFSPNNQLVNMKSSAQLVDKLTLPQLIRPQPLDVLKAWERIISSNFSNRIILESPTSTLNFPNNTPSIPNVGFVENQSMSLVKDITGMHDEVLMMMEQNIHDDSKFVESSFIPQIIKEKMENSIELHEMVYPNNAFPIMNEDFTELINVANSYNNVTKNNNDGLEVNWNNILDNLANSSPLSSVRINLEAIKKHYCILARVY